MIFPQGLQNALVPDGTVWSAMKASTSSAAEEKSRKSIGTTVLVFLPLSSLRNEIVELVASQLLVVSVDMDLHGVTRAEQTPVLADGTTELWPGLKVNVLHVSPHHGLNEFAARLAQAAVRTSHHVHGDELVHTKRLWRSCGFSRLY